MDEEDKQELEKVTQMIKRMKVDDKYESIASVVHSSDEVLESSLKK